MGSIASVNLGIPRPSDYTDPGVTGIDKRPTDKRIAVRAPGPKHGGLGSGLIGDTVCDVRHHGGDDQAVYAYAREDLDGWERELGRKLSAGVFGENLTTRGVDVNGALIGEHWQVGDELVLEVAVPRIPCRTFAGWMQEQGWIKRFTVRAVPGAYLRVVTAGEVGAGDAVRVLHRPDHDVSIAVVFRALTLEPELLPRLLAADALPEKVKELATKRIAPYPPGDEVD
jgi:MOSC domain-containing protein YiiM